MRRKWPLLMASILLLLTVSCARDVKKEEPTTFGKYQEPSPVARPSRPPAQPTPEDQQRRAIEEGQLQGRRTDRAALQAARENFMQQKIYFPYDSAQLTQEAQQILRDKASWLRQNSDIYLVIEGHCDERGTTEYNLSLGDRRAESVKVFLVNLGIPASRMTTISFGEERPAVPGNNDNAWALNRRAEFILE